jgi:hypothetical protein
MEKDEEEREGLELHGDGDGVMEVSARNVDWEKIEIVTFGPARRFSFFIYFEDLCKCLLLNTGG